MVWCGGGGGGAWVVGTQQYPSRSTRG